MVVTTPPTDNPSVTFEPAQLDDIDAMVALRIEAMRESLERIGRFDPKRARERFTSNFTPSHTRHVLVQGKRVGFVVVIPEGDELVLEHLYISPSAQGRGYGAQVLCAIFDEADSKSLPIRVGALRDSDSNRFYMRHGFSLVRCAEHDNYYVRASRNVL